MEGRAARQVGPFAEDDVVPAEARQPVRDRAAADAAADHDRSRSVPHARASRNRGSDAVRVSRSKCSSAYATKSNSSWEIACWTTPHIASRKSDMKRMRINAFASVDP